MLKLPVFAILLLLIGFIPVYSQSLLDLLDEEEEPIVYTFATFKTTRIINGHSVETNGKGTLQYVIAHRFGRLNSGVNDLFGLDNSTIRMEFAYGITDRIDVGVGRSSFQNLYDGFIKYKVLKQQSGAKNFPFTATLQANVAILTGPFPDPSRENFFSSRMFYTYQAHIARKFTDGFSMQISPTLIHRNLVSTLEDANDVLSIGIGARQKITSSLSINAEYFYTLPNQIVSNVNGEAQQDALSIGIDLETGGHVFQLHFTNSRGMAEKAFATETTGEWLDGDIHFGFNVSRVFSVGGRKKAE
jgi:hypothetical protein